MAKQISPQFISKEAFFKTYPTLSYGTDDKWLAVMTPDEKVCALALETFPNSHSLLNRYKKHRLVEKKIHLPEKLSCLLIGTALQHQVWQALLEIPRGETWSYQQLANHIQRPKAVRAVANAVGANPISPLIPCHRVIRHNNHIGGYYWGHKAKIALLQEEGVNVFALKGISLE
ncbi:MAG TPA: MGMT family protein [Alphaproteobacteria bacterium]|nr:MGMT family protein [Alphaproteobacteria bacterium]